MGRQCIINEGKGNPWIGRVNGENQKRELYTRDSYKENISNFLNS